MPTAYRTLFEQNERSADRVVAHNSLKVAYLAAERVLWQPSNLLFAVEYDDLGLFSYLVAGVEAGEGATREEYKRTHADLFRDVFGNPFRPASLDRDCATPDATKLAEGIYTEHAFDRMPILADALQDAGCEDADILTHLRGHGPHVRGCWVLDLVLGKS
jgi:hypothetical protein